MVHEKACVVKTIEHEPHYWNLDQRYLCLGVLNRNKETVVTEREEISDVVMAFYSVQDQRWNEHNYPYWGHLSRWNCVDEAVKGLPAPNKMMKSRIVREELVVLNTGEVKIISGTVVLDEDGVWNPNYDPRTSDPEWSTYIRLKEKFNG